MLARIFAFKDLGSRIIDPDISCFESYNQNYDKILADKYFYQRSCILLHDQEPLMYQNQIERWNQWRFNTSSFDDRMIILHSERKSLELDKFCNEMQAIPCHWFSNGALAIDWYQKWKWNLRLHMKLSRPRLHYKFSCLNRLISYQRSYRPVFSRMVMDIVDHHHLKLSCSLTDPVDGIRASDLDIPKKYLTLFKNLNMDIPITINIDSYDLEHGKILNQSYDACSNYFDPVFCHIATETLFTGPTLHLTEKSLRAFVNKRPMILLGPPHSLSYLRSYGFKTFGDFWDESYDSIEDPWARMEAVVELVKKLNQMSLNDMEDMLDNMQPILDHNSRHFFMDFPQVIIDELMTNMSSAISTAKSREANGWMLNRIKELDDAKFNSLMNGQIIDEFSNKELYDSIKQGDKTKMDYNLARVLLLDMGFDKESSKEEILARLKIILD